MIDKVLELGYSAQQIPICSYTKSMLTADSIIWRQRDDSMDEKIVIGTPINNSAVKEYNGDNENKLEGELIWFRMRC